MHDVCQLQNLGKRRREAMGLEAEFQRRLQIDKGHVRFCIEVYKMQMMAGRFFMHEHPNSSTSWQMPEMVALAAMGDVDSAVCDMCAYGMLAEDADGLAPAMKRTRILSNAAEVLKRIGRQCTNKESEERSRDKALEKKHRHANLMNWRAKQCQVYPREFCRAVCVGVAAQKQLYKISVRDSVETQTRHASLARRSSILQGHESV